jgi:hypothetical protein
MEVAVPEPDRASHPVAVPEPERAEPGGLGDKRAMLDGWLDYYRASLLRKCAA